MQWSTDTSHLDRSNNLFWNFLKKNPKQLNIHMWNFDGQMVNIRNKNIGNVRKINLSIENFPSDLFQLDVLLFRWYSELCTQNLLPMYTRPCIDCRWLVSKTTTISLFGSFYGTLKFFDLLDNYFFKHIFHVNKENKYASK